MFSEPRCVLVENWVSFRFVHGIYIFKWENIAAFLWKCVYLGGLKNKTLNFPRHLSAKYFLRLFLHNLGVLNFIFGVIHLQMSETKNSRQNHTSFIFLLHIIARFLVSVWFRVNNFMSHVFWSKWPLFDLQVQNGYRQHTLESCFHSCQL